MGLQETDAIVLRTYKLADADKIVLALTAEAGVVRGVARGARRLKSRFGAGLEPYTVISLQYYEKEGKELVSIRQADILRSYFHLLESEQLYQALEYVSELTVEFTPPQDPNPLMYRMVKATLEALGDEPENFAAVLRYFEIWLLRLGGLLPELNVCGRCARQLSQGDEAFYRAGEALYCHVCAPAAARKLSPRLRERLKAAQKMPPAQFVKAKASADDIGDLRDFTQSHIVRALEREPQRTRPASDNIKSSAS